jgi:hypothetical protein
MAGVLGAFAVATAQGAAHEKVLVCHGTASASNPLVLIEVSQNALNGHFDVGDGGTLVATGHGKQNAPDQYSPLDGSGFTGDCLDLYNESSGGGE